MFEKEKQVSKLILFNHSRNPYLLGKNADGSKRIFAVGESMECRDQAEYDQLSKYRGVSTTAQVAPGLNTYVAKLEAEKAELQQRVAELESQQEKFKKKEK